MSAESAIWSSIRKPWSRLDVVALAVWTVAIAVVFRDAVIFQGALFYFDVTELNFPYRAFLFRELGAGRLSFWLPNLYCGLPLFSESQAGYFHPLKYLLYPWLPTWRAFNLDTVLSVWLAGVGAYGWLRRHVGVLGSLTGAAIIGLGGYTWAHLIHTSMINALASVPFAVWALESSWDGGRYRAAALGAIALAIQVFAGHLQDTILTCSVLGVYSLLRCFGERSSSARLNVLLTAFVMMALAGLIAAVQLVPSKELLDRSPRAEGLSWEDQTYGSWHPQLIPALLVHEIYGTRSRDTDWMDGFFPYHEMNAYLGIVGLFLAAIGAKAWRDRWVGTWCVIAMLSVLFMLGRYTFLWDYLHKVPIIGSSRIPVRFHLWVTLATAALAAVGVDRIARFEPDSPRVSVLPGIWFVAAITSMSCVILFVTYRPIVTESFRWTQSEHTLKFSWLGRELIIAVSRNLLLILAAVVCALKAKASVDARQRAGWSMWLPILLIADLALAHTHDIPTVSPAYWTEAPESVGRVKSDPSLVRIYGEGTRSSGEPGHASKPIDFMPIRETIAWSLPAVWDVPSTGGETPIISSRRFRFGELQSPTRYDLEGLSHILSVKPEVSRLGKAEQAGAAYIHKNPRVLPRVRIVGDPLVASDERDAKKKLIELGTAARNRVIIEVSDKRLIAGKEASGDARITHETPDHLEVVADIRSKDGYLLLADTFDPGWTATVDDIPAPIIPANVAFRAVYLSKGTHKLRFDYRPVGLIVGGIISAVGLVVTIGLLVWRGAKPTLRSDHDLVSAAPRIRLIAVSCFLAILALSVVGPGSRISVFDRRRNESTIQHRLADSFHPFTWGAKTEAIKPPPPPLK